VGIALGVLAPSVAVSVTPVSTIFLRLIKSIIAPLLFGTLVYGIAGAGNIRQMGRIGLKAIIYFEIVTTAALALGLGIVNLVRPGAGMSLEKTAAEGAVAGTPASLPSVLEHVFPASVIDAMARGDVLQVVVFSLLFGAACGAIGVKAQPVVASAQSLAEVMFRYTRYVMYLAPFGVAAAIGATVGRKGFGILPGAGKLVVTMYAAQLLFILLLAAVAWMVRIPTGPFAALSVNRSSSPFLPPRARRALPSALENMERFGVPKHIVAFVLPAGYSFNLDGSTLYLSLSSMFVAQAAGIDLTFSQQLLMMLTLMLTSKGVAGVPRGALVILAGTLASFQPSGGRRGCAAGS